MNHVQLPPKPTHPGARVSVPVRKDPAAMSFPSILLTKAASHLPPFGPVKLPGDQHAPNPFAHLRAPSRTVFYSFLPFFAAIASRKPTQGCASQNNLTPHLHDLRLPALPRSGPLPFHFLTLQPFNLLERHFGTKMKILKTESFSTSTLQERFRHDRRMALR